MKTVVITGGGKGLGAAITNVFASNEWTILVGSRTKENSEVDYSGKILFKSCDATKKKQHIELAQYAIEKTGRLDCWINNVGLSAWKPLENIDEEFLDEMLAVNLKSVFWGCQAASKTFTHGGTIINVSSLAGKRGSSNNSAYCAAKFGVNGLTQSLAKELGPKNIKVNAVCPVYIETAGLKTALAENISPTGGQDIKNYLNDFSNSQAALKRLPQGEEVGKLCCFLASGAADAITGQCINIDCGIMPC